MDSGSHIPTGFGTQGESRKTLGIAVSMYQLDLIKPFTSTGCNWPQARILMTAVAYTSAEASGISDATTHDACVSQLVGHADFIM